MRDNYIPFYEQVKKEILREIKSRSKEEGLKISSEREYSKKFNVSRITVKRAIDELVQEKYLVRVIGKGTYISDTERSLEFSNIISFTEDMHKRHVFDLTSKIIFFDLTSETKECAKVLNIAKSEKVFRLKRIRFANNIPMTIQDSYIRSDLCYSLTNYDFCVNSLYNIIGNEYKLKLKYAKNILEVRLITEEEKKLFNIKKTIAVFILIQTTFLENGKPIEFVTSIYRGDKYKFHNIAHAI